MEKIVENEKCCGCHACFNSCPKGAIEMREDEKGFKYPIINQDKCINCGLCKKVCPVINSFELEHDFDAYACFNKNVSERLNSSSGGIFILLANEIIKRNGVVFGARFDNNFDIIHSYCECSDDLSLFMGSKYSQSFIGDSYKKVKDFLDSDRYVLFTGTPCQIEGLKFYLRKEYNKLYTQDFICHGVPSPKLWRKYLKFQTNFYKEKIQNVSFRNKDNGWSSFQTKISFDTKTYIESFDKDLYMKAFLNNVCLRDSCYNCSFKKKYRISDITLADYWGIRNLHSELDDDKGISLVVVNSNKGKELFDAIKSNINYKKTDLDKAIKYNSAMIKSATRSPKEKEFYNNIDTMDINALINKYVPKPTFIRKIKNIIKKIIKK